MRGWKSHLRADQTGWLLGEDNPSVRYFTLTDILDKRADDPEVVEAKRAVMRTGAVPRILAKQGSGGYWGDAENFYAPGKYKATVWQLMILAEFAADPGDERVRKACEFILDRSQDRESGGFSYLGDPGAGGRHMRVIPCLTGNMVWSLIRLGYLGDPRVQMGIEWITRYQRFDDGDTRAPKEWPYGRRSCWGRHSCHMGVVKALKALSEIPEDERPPEVRRTITEGAEYLLRHHVHKRSHDLARVSKPEWLQFGFPLMWNTDALEALGVLTGLGYRDDRMGEAIDLVLSKQDEEGRWTLERTFNGRFQVDVERKNMPSKWVTLNALRVLKRFYAQ